MHLLIVILPLIGSFAAGFFGRSLGSRGVAVVTTTCVSLSSISSRIAFCEVALCASACYTKIAPRIFSELFDAAWGSSSDSPTVILLLVVTIVSSLVHIHPISHMSEDPHSPRFFCYLSIPTSSTPMSVTGDNSIQLFLGWEGVGPAPYLSINFWFTRIQASKAAIKAMLINRIGDSGLALGIMGRFTILQTVDSSTIFACASASSEPHHYFLPRNMGFHAITVIRISASIGAVGKPAQIGLHTRLPDAMEGPTPVSALIHAATTVTAGVSMIARCSPSFEYSPNASIVITFVGAMTSLFAATTGILQNDSKRVIAYSTRSQSGYTIFACGISNYSVSVFHLMNHACFKALLFLSAGSVIHAMSDEQDMRKMGGLASLLPFTYATMPIGSSSLIGSPSSTGFYPKDVTPELAYTKYTTSGNFAFRLGSVSVSFTPYYSSRLLFLTLPAPTNSFKRDLSRCHDAPILMAIPLIFSAFGSIFAGYLAKDMMIGLGTNSRANSLLILPKNEIMAESEFATPTITKPIPILFSILGSFVAYSVNSVVNPLIFALKTSAFGNRLYCFFNKRWFFDKVFNDFLARSFPRFGYEVSFKASDKGAIEILGPRGISYTIRKMAQQISQIQSGFVHHYAFVMSLGLTIFISVIGPWDLISFWVDNRSYFIYIVSFLFLNIWGSISTN
uniref:NADH-ubiquinone oxidoreductase chain 5 n=1 Tax=Haplomitrium mnioides TaxID=56921 RepID=A0A6C0SII3_9MARC|nr:NADH dehydrogenase subunit 5 [Haplomitrium mnioides]QIA60179.1 NADH dehydrogenase subunit 5 [Haplomitrium mnioides]